MISSSMCRVSMNGTCYALTNPAFFPHCMSVTFASCFVCNVSSHLLHLFGVDLLLGTGRDSSWREQLIVQLIERWINWRKICHFKLQPCKELLTCGRLQISSSLSVFGFILHHCLWPPPSNTLHIWHILSYKLKRVHSPVHPRRSSVPAGRQLHSILL